MNSLSQCIQNLFRNLTSRFQSAHNPVQTEDAPSVIECPVVEIPIAEQNNNSEIENTVTIENTESEGVIENETPHQECSELSDEDDLPELIPVIVEDYGTEEELEDRESNEDDEHYYRY
jgi:hypothetical protein